MQDTKLRIIHGVTGAAGQPSICSKAQRKLGYKSDSLLIRHNKFGYSADHHAGAWNDTVGEYNQILNQITPEYDVFHFYFRPLFGHKTRGYDFPAGLDLLLLRALGKIVVLHYRGSEIRLASKFKQATPFNYVDENPSKLFTKFPEEAVLNLREMHQAICHHVWVPDPELQTYVPNATIIPRAIDLQEWPLIGSISSTDPLIIHAPSREVVKGTKYVLKAVEELRNEGLKFQFQLIKNIPNSEARELYKKADIIVDQLRIGWYGVLALEAMSLGKAVVTYIRDDLVSELPEKKPLAVASPLTIKAVLRDLITNYELRKTLGASARTYVESYHDSKLVAQQMLDLYESAKNNPKPLDTKAILNFIEKQTKLMHKNAKFSLASWPAKIKNFIASYYFSEG